MELNAEEMIPTLAYLKIPRHKFPKAHWVYFPDFYLFKDDIREVLMNPQIPRYLAPVHLKQQTRV